MATYISAVVVTFVLILVTLGYMVSKQPQNLSTTKQLDVKDVGDVSLESNLLKEWDASCHSASTTGQFTLSTRFYIGPMTFTGPCYANKRMVVNVVGNVVAKPKNAWQNNSTTWIKFEHVQNLHITGTGNFNGQGLDWWNSCNKNKPITCKNNPTALAFNDCPGLWLEGVTSKNSPRNHISINGCNGATISNINIMAPEESPNTDGIDISNTNGLNINGGHIGTGDDCIAINGNSFNINITNLNCGPGHGISVGSLGRNGATDNVRNIRVIGTNFFGTQNGVRIKTVPGGSGSASQITFSNIGMTNVRNPIVLTQFYCPHTFCPKDILPVVKISGVSFIGIHGTSSTNNAIYINCSSSQNSCVGITLENIRIQPANPSIPVGSVCKNAIVRTIGIVLPGVVCTKGPSIIEMPLDYNNNESEQAIATS